MSIEKIKGIVQFLMSDFSALQVLRNSLLVKKKKLFTVKLTMVNPNQYLWLSFQNMSREIQKMVPLCCERNLRQLSIIVFYLFPFLSYYRIIVWYSNYEYFLNCFVLFIFLMDNLTYICFSTLCITIFAKA